MTGSRRLSASVPRVSGNGSEASPQAQGRGRVEGVARFAPFALSQSGWTDKIAKGSSAPPPPPARGGCVLTAPQATRVPCRSPVHGGDWTERRACPRPAAAPSRSGGRGDDGAHVVRGRALLLRAQKGVCSGRGLSPLPVGERRLSRPPSPSPTTLDYRRKKRREQPERARPRQAGLGPLWEREHCGPKR